MPAKKPATKAPVKKSEIKEELAPDIKHLSSNEGVAEIVPYSKDSESEPLEEVSLEILDEAFAINKEIEDAKAMEEMCIKSDRAFKRYELVSKLIQGRAPDLNLSHCKPLIQQFIAIADIALDLLEKADEKD